MTFFTRGIRKLGVNYELRNVRSKFTKATVLKTVNEPLVLEDFKIADKLKEGQVIEKKKNKICINLSTYLFSKQTCIVFSA